MGSKTQIAGQNAYTALLWTLKLAVCSFYSRLTVCRRPRSTAQTRLSLTRQ